MSCQNESCRQGRAVCTDQCELGTLDWISTSLIVTYYLLGLFGLSSVSFLLGYAWVFFKS